MLDLEYRHVTYLKYSDQVDNLLPGHFEEFRTPGNSYPIRLNSLGLSAQENSNYRFSMGVFEKGKDDLLGYISGARMYDMHHYPYLMCMVDNAYISPSLGKQRLSAFKDLLKNYEKLMEDNGTFLMYFGTSTYKSTGKLLERLGYTEASTLYVKDMKSN